MPEPSEACAATRSAWPGPPSSRPGRGTPRAAPGRWPGRPPTAGSRNCQPTDAPKAGICSATDLGITIASGDLATVRPVCWTSCAPAGELRATLDPQRRVGNPGVEGGTGTRLGLSGPRGSGGWLSPTTWTTAQCPFTSCCALVEALADMLDGRARPPPPRPGGPRPGARCTRRGTRRPWRRTRPATCRRSRPPGRSARPRSEPGAGRPPPVASPRGERPGGSSVHGIPRSGAPRSPTEWDPDFIGAMRDRSGSSLVCNNCPGRTGPIEVTDPGDPRLADYVALTDSALRISLEARDGLFVAEGEKVIRRALAAGLRDPLAAGHHRQAGPAGRAGGRVRGTRLRDDRGRGPAAHRLPGAPGRAGLGEPPRTAPGAAGCWPRPGGCWSSRTWSITATSGRSSGARRRSASTR